ncbi:MAG: N-acetylmuramoyl-L-alanine amidase [Bacteroidales bacterium]|nr:N-acetylmuramoyl-L-alanine amidase [Bacteroidales bacterium]MCF8405055.1 N-acetylmuramoyl-L-alanine amidase [Bacteroidales bacterium]
MTKLVIDAGHGGKDPGALGKNSKEKDIVLAVALKAGMLIEKNYEDVEVIYTRKSDVFIELHKRAQIANESGADLFISIHCNSNKSSSPYGAETYVMGLHKSEDNLEVAKTENASIFYEEDYAEQYEGFNPNSDEDYIILSMFQSVNIEQSINFSSKVQNQFKEKIGRRDRGVKQAGFWVLYKTTMPGILVELGFLSNPKEEEFLLTKQGQDYLAEAIFEAFQEYKKEFEEENKDLQLVLNSEPEKKVPEIFYRIQFASYKKEKSLDFRKFRGLDNIKVYQHDGQYKYTTGNETDIEKISELKKELIEKGYKDVFIVAFRNEERISLDEAKKQQFR